MANAEKVAAVAELTDKFRDSSGAVLTEYRGLTVAQLAELRRAGVLPDPPVRPYPFADAPGALREIAGRGARGKIVLSRTAA